MARSIRRAFAGCALGFAAAIAVGVPALQAWPPTGYVCHYPGCKLHGCKHHGQPPPYVVLDDSAGNWFWVRSPDEEKRVAASLYNRYCLRCHGAEGGGVWDMPDIPDFTSIDWQESRSDGQLVRLILEGRGAIMPPFRGTLSLEESWAVVRYLRTFDDPVEEISASKSESSAPLPVPKQSRPKSGD